MTVKRESPRLGGGYQLPPHTKLTPEQVRAIRESYSQGATARELAEAFGIKKEAIWSITSGKTWPDAGGPIYRKKRRMHPTGPNVAPEAGDVRCYRCGAGPQWQGVPLYNWPDGVICEVCLFALAGIGYRVERGASPQWLME